MRRARRRWGLEDRSWRLVEMMCIGHVSKSGLYLDWFFASVGVEAFIDIWSHSTLHFTNSTLDLRSSFGTV